MLSKYGNNVKSKNKYFLKFVANLYIKKLFENSVVAYPKKDLGGLLCKAKL